jgi:hypothetical protein
MSRRPKTLLEYLGRRHQEWVAQGALRFLLENEPAVAELVRERCELPQGCGFPVVEEETGTDELSSTWRPDLQLIWPAVKRTLKAELKVTAALTRQQLRALAQDQIDLLVVPSQYRATDERRPPNKPTVLRWRELAAVVPEQHASLRQLLTEADAGRKDLKPKLSADEAQADFACWLGGSSPTELDAFLNALENELLLLLPENIRFTRSTWMRGRTRRAGPFTGFDFEVETTSRGSLKFWGGFVAPKGDVSKLWFAMDDPCSKERPLVPGTQRALSPGSPDLDARAEAAAWTQEVVRIVG